MFELIRQDKLEEARELLLIRLEQRPRDQQSLRYLAEICGDVDDIANLFWAAERLIVFDSQDLDAYAHRFNVALSAALPAVAIRTAKIMKRLPHDSEYDEQIEKFLAEFDEKKLVEEFRRESTMGGDDFSAYDDETVLNLLVDHERCLFYLQHGKFELVAEICDGIIRTCPLFRSAFNNKALAILLGEGAEKAGPALDEALERHPKNVFALSFKIQQLVKLGQRDELPPFLERLKVIQPWQPKNNLDFFAAKIDAFAWAGEEVSLLETYKEAETDAGDDWKIENDRSCAHMAYFAAIALALRGETDEAMALLKRAVRCPGAENAIAENIADLRKPEGERNGPWYFELNDWIPRRFFLESHAACRRHGITEAEDEAEKKFLVEQHVFPLYIRAYQRWPYLRPLRTEMLRRGDQGTRNWVLLNIGDYPRASACYFA
ncbi:MAG: hypothetical protein FWC43_13195 [Planctomycetaceae bacterium]|nr:hypothetical protein [Planctomycetaceae bacterium]